MAKALGWIAICCLGLQASIALAGSADDASKSLDSASSEALLKTQQMLQDPAMRSKVVGDSISAQTVDSQVKSLAGNPQATEDIYKISGQVLEDLVKETGGDPVKMLQIMNQAQTDPKGFMSHVSEENKQAIHDISTKIETAPTTRQPAAATAPAPAGVAGK